MTNYGAISALRYRRESSCPRAPLDGPTGRRPAQVSADVTLDAVESIQAAEERAETTPQAEPDYSAVEGFLEQLPIRTRRPSRSCATTLQCAT